MRRREFIAGLGGAAVWPVAARAQQSARPMIGFLSSRSFGESEYVVASFRRGLSESGFVEGENVSIEFRWADGRYDRLSELGADLVRRRVALIVAAGGGVSALAAKAATPTIPIVFIVGDIDPVDSGLVVSLNRPGGNITGISPFTTSLAAKRLELLHQMVPKVDTIGVLVNPTNPSTESELKSLLDAAGTLRLQLQIAKATSERAFNDALATLVQQGAGALLLGADNFFTSQRDLLLALAARHALPAAYYYGEFAAGGGLMSYGPSLADSYRQSGVYAGRILRGEKPADLPVQQPIKFEFVINLKTAKTLGIEIPPTLLTLADEVIE